MFYSLKGKLVYCENGQVAIDVNGVAYLCNVSFNTFGKVGALGSEVTLFTYLKVSEDALDLYGFSAKEELEAFKMLITVSGVGPKAALSVLSELTPQQLYLAVAGGDLKKITAAQGVGAKVGQRIIVDLKDKVKKLGSGGDSDTFVSGAGVVGSVNAGAASEAVSALVMLGYSQSEASIAVSKLDSSLSVEDMIKQALRYLG